MKTVGFTTHSNYVVGHVENIIKGNHSKKFKLSMLPDVTWYIETENEMTESHKAFMKSFQDNFNQHDVRDDDIEEFLIGDSSESFEGYGAVADAYSLWGDAIAFAKTLAVDKTVV